MRRALPVLCVALLLAAGPGAAQGAPRPGGAPAGGPDGPPPDRFPLALAMRAIDEKASLLLEQGKTDAALAEMKRAFALDVPKDGPAYEMKAQLIGRFAVTLAEAGRKKDAVETIQKLLAEAPAGSVAEANAWLDAGSVYRKAGMPEEALKAFDRSLELAQKLAKIRPAGDRPPRRPPQGERRGPPPPRSPGEGPED